MKDREEVKVGVDAVRCDRCDEYKIAMNIARNFSWVSDCDKAIGFDRETQEIIVNSQAIMRIIQMMNPVQEDRKIRLVSQDEFYGVKK